MTEPQITEADREKAAIPQEWLDFYAEYLPSVDDLRALVQHFETKTRAPLEARIAELERQVAGLTTAAGLAATYLIYLEDNLLKNDVDTCLDACDPPSAVADRLRQALTDHGAASLARHEAEVMERAAQIAENFSYQGRWELTTPALLSNVAAAIRAAKPSEDLG